MVTMFNQVNGRLNGMQAEMNRRFDIMQAENQRQHDVMQEVLHVFEGRTTRLEEKAGIGPKTPSNEPLAPAYRCGIGDITGEPHFRIAR